MIRNEKTGKFETENKNPEYGFYSKVLNKPFDSLVELREAEAAVRKAEEEKKAAAEAKRAEAAKVEEAYKALNAVKRAYNEGVIEAKKVYVKFVSEAKDKYNEAVEKLDASLQAAQEVYDKALEEFNKAHPEGFHITLKDGDNVSTISYSSSETSSPTTSLIDFLFRNF